MKNITHFADAHKNQKIDVKYILTDIDDTLSSEGKLRSNAYDALWKLKDYGLKIIPITGRPAGWCEMIARFWPVEGVVGENGGLCFYYKNNQMRRWYHADENIILENQKKLARIRAEILKTIPDVAISSDQFCRLTDLAIDFCEDIPKASLESIASVQKIFSNHGATSKVSSIHINGWFGEYNKLSTTKKFMHEILNLTEDEIFAHSVFVGDSLNDEPMFEAFPLSIGVANVLDFKSQFRHLPTYITNNKSGDGFVEIANILIS